MRRLRRLTEAECYARCYGRGGGARVTALDVKARAGTSGRLSPDDVRRLFEGAPPARARLA